jgi:hypothetical protein
MALALSSQGNVSETYAQLWPYFWLRGLIPTDWIAVNETATESTWAMGPSRETAGISMVGRFT